jgi:hypothetical protein
LYGAASGGGKSWLLRVAAILYALRVPGCQVYLFRRTFPDLFLNHVEGEIGLPMVIAPLLERGPIKWVSMKIGSGTGAGFLCDTASPRLTCTIIRESRSTSFS